MLGFIVGNALHLCLAFTPFLARVLKPWAFPEHESDKDERVFCYSRQALSATPEFVNEARFGKSLEKHTMGLTAKRSSLELRGLNFQPPPVSAEKRGLGVQ